MRTTYAILSLLTYRLQVCRIMIHGRNAADEEEYRVRLNTNAAKWSLEEITIGVLAYGAVLVRYLLYLLLADANSPS